MNANENHLSNAPLGIAHSQPANPPRKPYTPPAILHELALETRAGSVLGVDPVEEILGIPTK